MSKLMKAQLEYLQFAHGKRGAAAFMDMGLGKTFALLAEFVESDADAGIVVCPNSLKGNWADEVSKHDIKCNPWIWNGDHRRADLYLKNVHKTERPLLIINYEAIRSPKTMQTLETYCEVFGGNVFIIFDESVQISTHDSNQTKAAIHIAKLCAFRRVLSGKPTRSGPHDLWSQLRAIGALDGFNYYAFRTTFCKMGGFRGKQVLGAKNEDRLAEILAPVAFFARKEDYLDLPPKTYTKRQYFLGPVLAEHYNTMLNEFVTYLSDEECVTVDVAITKYEKLTQIQAGFVIDEAGKTHLLVEDRHNPRLQLVKEIMDETSGKVCIAYRHKQALAMLMVALKDYGPVHISGGMIDDDIGHSKYTFNNDPSCRVILLQMQSSKYGHTLLGDQLDDMNACQTMIFFENTYSLDDRSQIEDRIHRIGQTRNTLYVDMVGTDMDKRVVDALQRKENVFQAILSAVKSTNLK